MTPGRMTFEDFLAWGDEDTWAEWVDGEVVVLTPAAVRHQRIARFLGDLLGNFVLMRQLGEVIPAPFTIKLAVPLKRGREPDIVFISREQLHRLKPTYFDGAPDLVVEVLSPGTIRRDRGRKSRQYFKSGVREFWLVDPQERLVEVFVPGEKDWQRAGVYEEEDEEYITSTVLPGLEVKARDILVLP